MKLNSEDGKIALSSFFGKIGAVGYALSRKIYQSSQAKRVAPWFQVNGDNTLRQRYDLDQDSVVYDLGGYKGQWASDIYSRYCSKIFIFEPALSFYEDIEKRFSNNEDIIVYPFGLANGSFEAFLSMQADGSSIYGSDDVEKSKICLVDAVEFIKKQQHTCIDLMKINIEGAEFDLLDYLIENEMIPKIRNLQIQFHDKVPNAHSRMKAIQKKLAESHKVTWQYEFVWENWERS